jgi:hypothetical protein
MPGRDSTSNAPPERRGIILEIVAIGASQKVTAVDEATGTEVSFIAPASAARADIERLARSKLAYVLQKKS